MRTGNSFPGGRVKEDFATEGTEERKKSTAQQISRVMIKNKA
jgi:hypothetical protein